VPARLRPLITARRLSATRSTRVRRGQRQWCCCSSCRELFRRAAGQRRVGQGREHHRASRADRRRGRLQGQIPLCRRQAGWLCTQTARRFTPERHGLAAANPTARGIGRCVQVSKTPLPIQPTPIYKWVDFQLVRVTQELRSERTNTSRAEPVTDVSVRSSVLWAFCRRVVQLSPAAFEP
jgi:hypothetical protein